MDPKDLHIETERLLIRPYTVEDAPALKHSVDESLEELSPYMPWAKFEPQALASKIELINAWNKEIQNDTNYNLGIFDKETGEFIGSTGLHKRNRKRIIEIGYWCATKHTKKGFITESSKALTTFAFNNLDMDSVHIVTEDINKRSAAIPDRLGYNLEYSCRTGEFNKEGKRKIANYWVIFKEEWKG